MSEVSQVWFDEAKKVDWPYTNLINRTTVAKGALKNKIVPSDALTMALRLLSEEEHTFSTECSEVMGRWRPIAERVLRDE